MQFNQFRNCKSKVEVISPLWLVGRRLGRRETVGQKMLEHGSWEIKINDSSKREKGKFFRKIFIFDKYLYYAHYIFQALYVITLAWFLGMDAHVIVSHLRHFFPEAKVETPEK